MSKLQKFFLIFACVFFIATIYSLFFLKPVFIIIFFTLHSLCLFSFCYVCYSDQMDKVISFKAYHQEVGMEMAEKDKEISDISGRLKKRESLIDQIRSQMDSFRSQNESSKKEISTLHSRIRELEEKLKREQEIIREKEQEKEQRSRDVGALLPPLTPGKEERETVNIIEIANQAKDSLQSDAKKSNLHVTISSATDTLLVSADPGRLMTLFRNIIDNSIKYMNRPGALVITISTIGDDIFIVLKDTGEGLPNEETKYIFELNYQGSNRISGNGLGLAQARAIVEYYGGTIYAKSTVGNGMGIYIQIPAGGRI